jgi:hypothetical protein
VASRQVTAYGFRHIAALRAFTNKRAIVAIALALEKG